MKVEIDGRPTIFNTISLYPPVAYATDAPACGGGMKVFVVSGS